MSTSSENFFNGTKRGRGEVKHAILKYYLGGYFGCLGQTPYYHQLIYVDGFSGPGRYEATSGTVEDGHEDGSPIVAIKTVINHLHCNNFNKPIRMYFIEADQDYATQLEHNIVELMQSNPNHRDILHIKIVTGEFYDAMNLILNELNGIRCPMLVFADPFGIEPVPMELMRRIVNRPLTELFMNVMFSSVIRWINTPHYKKVLNKFVGEENSEWKKSVLKGNKSESFIRYYVEKLTGDQPQIYRHIFGMKNEQNRHIYQLVFVSHHLKGLINMKNAMFKCSQESEKFVYSEFIENNPEKASINRLSKEEIREKLNQEIKEKFDNGIVNGVEIGRFVWEETPFIFNLKRELKNDFKNFIVLKNNDKFDEMVFDFSASMD